MNTPKYIVIHHSWSPDHPELSDWEGIRDFHVRVNGWRDVGYHFGIELINYVPTLRIGRNVFSNGAHAHGFNNCSIGLCVLGCYDVEVPSTVLWQFIIDFCNEQRRNHPIPIYNIIGHRITYAMRGLEQEKTCPGKLFNMVKLREDLRGK